MIVRLLLLLIRAYQLTLSPLLGQVCRFHPSCSRYAYACLRDHGLFGGGLLSLKRLARCHPFHPGGHDPPPPPPGPAALSTHGGPPVEASPPPGAGG
ncbi:MAG: membrane protein insertion efficiency factor YidD [Polyangiaceae bacterium]|jgi:uncharacterized protein|nr:membrane protein insertion efficiency factor YidD [Polyangiaceae bacterium]